MKLYKFPKPPIRFWWVFPDEPGSSRWRAELFGEISGDVPVISRAFRDYVIDKARCHPEHYGLPVIAQVEVEREERRGRAK